jgi:hypothetical protein
MDNPTHPHEMIARKLRSAPNGYHVECGHIRDGGILENPGIFAGNYGLQSRGFRCGGLATPTLVHATFHLNLRTDIDIGQ